MAHWMEADIEQLLTGTGGVAVSHTPPSGPVETGKGVIDEIDEVVLEGRDVGMLSDHSVVTVRSLAFPTLSNGDAITVGGVVYKITDHRKIGDGALTQVIYRVPTP